MDKVSKVIGFIPSRLKYCSCIAQTCSRTYWPSRNFKEAAAHDFAAYPSRPRCRYPPITIRYSARRAPMKSTRKPPGKKINQELMWANQWFQRQQKCTQIKAAKKPQDREITMVVFQPESVTREHVQESSKNENWGVVPHFKNKSTIEKFLMSMVKDQTKTIKPHCPVKSTNTPSRMIKGL